MKLNYLNKSEVALLVLLITFISLSITTKAETLGYTTVGGSYTGVTNIIVGSNVTVTEDGETINISVFTDVTGDAKNWKAALYNESLNLVESTNEVLVSAGAAWTNFSLSSPVTLTTGELYWIVAWPEGGTGANNIHYDSQAGASKFQSLSYGAWPDPWETTDFDNVFSIFLTYTPAAAGYTEISDCGTLSANNTEYRLTADIIDSDTGSCMDITGVNITLDCQGYTIDGDDSADFGIYIDDGTVKYGNITVKNCIVSDWRSEGFWIDQISGVTLFNSSFNSCENNSGNGGQVSRAYDVLINYTTFDLNEDGVRFWNAYNSTVANSNFTNQTQYGMMFDTANDNITVYNSVFINNSVASLDIDALTIGWFYNNFFNDSNFVDGDTGTTILFNASNQTGTRIYGNGTNTGGNFYVGFSESCTDSTNDGFCDSPYNVSSQSTTALSGDYVDFLAYSANQTGTDTYPTFYDNSTNITTIRYGDVIAVSVNWSDDSALSWAFAQSNMTTYGTDANVSAPMSGTEFNITLNITNNLKYSGSSKLNMTYIQLHGNDSSNQFNTSEYAFYTISNTAPNLTANPTLNETSPKTNDVLKCNAGTYSDADGNAQGTSSWAWFNNGDEVAGETSQTLDLSTSGLDKGDVVTCSERPNDGFDDGAWLNSSNSATIQNTAPSFSSASIDQATAYNGTNLTGSATGYADDDGDAESGSTYKWFNNGEEIAGETNMYLNASNFVKNSQIIFEATPSDGTDSGDPVNSSQLTIGNSVPSIPEWVFPTEGVITTLNDLNVSNLSDADLDSITLYFYFDAEFNQTSSANTTFTATPGNLTANVSAYDGTAWSDNRTVNFFFDNITALIDNGTNTDQSGYKNVNWVFINYSWTETFNDTFVIRNGTGGVTTNFTGVNGNDTYFWFNFTALNDGVYTFSGWINDTAGNWNQTEDITITVDTVLPVSVFASPTPSNASYVSSSVVNISWNITDVNLKNLSVNIYNDTGLLNGTWSTALNGSINYTLNDAHYIVNVTINDLAGNSNVSEDRNFTVDTMYPTVNITLPTANFTTTETNITLNFSSVEVDYSFCYYELIRSDGSAAQTNTTISCTANTSFISPVRDVLRINLYVNDSAGNANSSYQVFNVIKPAPITSGTSSPEQGGGGGGSASGTGYTATQLCEAITPRLNADGNYSELDVQEVIELLPDVSEYTIRTFFEYYTFYCGEYNGTTLTAADIPINSTIEGNNSNNKISAFLQNDTLIIPRGEYEPDITLNLRIPVGHWTLPKMPSGLIALLSVFFHLEKTDTGGLGLEDQSVIVVAIRFWFATVSIGLCVWWFARTNRGKSQVKTVKTAVQKPFRKLRLKRKKKPVTTTQ